MIGIGSFGIKKWCGQGYPSVYTSIDYYLHWIIDNMRTDLEQEIKQNPWMVALGIYKEEDEVCR